jgi:hypothetical protein
MPFVALYTALGLARVVSWFPERPPARGRFGSGRLHPYLAGLLFAAAIAPPAVDVVRLDRLVQQTDTRVLAARWIVEHLPPGTKILAQSTGLPIGRTGPGDGLDGYDVSRTYTLNPPDYLLEQVCGEGRRYLVLSSFDYELHRLRSRPGEAPTSYELLERDGELLQTFSPSVSGQPIPYDPDDAALPFWRAAEFARPGSTIRLYHLGEGGPFACAPS